MQTEWMSVDLVFHSVGILVFGCLMFEPRQTLRFIFRGQAAGISDERIGALRALAVVIVVSLAARLIMHFSPITIRRH